MGSSQPSSLAGPPRTAQELSAALAEAQARAVELERELARAHRLATLGVLAGSIAHEFNNILTPVLSYAQMAQAAPADRDLTEKAIQKAIDGSQKAAQIGSAMLGFLRDDEAEAVTNAAAAVSDALACVARDPRKDGIGLTLDLAPDCWAAIRPVALQQILLNLILNAREAMRGRIGGIKVRVATCSTWNAQGPAGVRIEVSDDGCGMAPEVAARIFDPFYRGKQGENAGDPGSQRKGTGLGLAITRRLVEEAGGTIEVASTAGKGTTFTVLIPGAAGPIGHSQAA